MNIETSTWFRESTQEWIIEMVVTIEGKLHSDTRYSGKTQLEALRFFQENVSEYLKNDLDLITD